MKKQLLVFNFGSWEPTIDEACFSADKKGIKQQLNLKLSHLVYNRDGRVSSHYTAKNLRTLLRELTRDSYSNHNDYYIVISKELEELFAPDELKKFATFCYHRRWNCKKKPKVKK